MSASDHVDILMRRFARLLASAWDEVLAASLLSNTGSFLEDWLQANWEMFVEGGLAPTIFLEVYGEGADCNGESSRVYRPDVTATHVVVCLPKPGATTISDILTNEEIVVAKAGLPIEELVSMEGTWYARKPPFDCILVEQGDKTYLFNIDDLVFSLSLASN
jgi:hypothetical protein